MSCSCAKSLETFVVNPSCPEHIGRSHACDGCGKRWWSHWDSLCWDCWHVPEPTIWREHGTMELHVNVP